MIDYKIFISTYCYDNKVSVPYMRSILEFMKICRDKKIPYTHNIISVSYENSTMAKNICIASFLSQSDYTHFMFIDSNILFEPSSIFKLIDSDKDIVGGVYPKKRFNYDNIFDNINNNNSTSKLLEQQSSDYIISIDNKKKVDDKHCIPVNEIGSGFLMIKRNVFKKIIKSFPEIKTHNFYSFFDIKIDDNNFISDDLVFCKRWINMDGTIFARTDIKLTYIGILKYEGSFRSLLTHEK